MGHGSLLLGHSHPQVTAAVAEQAQKGTHYGACHELEVAWAEQITRLIPQRRVGALHDERHRGDACWPCASRAPSPAAS